MNGTRARPWARVIWCALFAGCAVTPLTNRIAPGEDAFVIAVGEGPDAMTDLYAAPAGGGTFTRLTFNRAPETAPRLSPSGTAVAFFRREGVPGAVRWSVIILDLRTNAERRTFLRPGAAPVRLGWRPDGASLVVEAGGFWSLEPGRDTLARVDVSAAAAADSLTRELLGDPPIAMIRDCPSGEPCIVSAGGETGGLGAGARDPVRWGADSVAYFTTRGFEVRPLAGGVARRPAWRDPPARLRMLTYHPGKPGQ